ncbi:MAG: DUF4878 domain-containing protein [Muribaculaceae bacterium]|nr:DUF4878 domain-containing protein [Muribaculaceae bacterium]
MKTRLFIASIVLAVMAVIVSSCDKKPATPGEAFKQYATCLADKDYEGYVDGCDLKTAGQSEEKIKEARTTLIGLLQLSAGETDKKGGIKNVEILEETINEGDTTAVVKAKFTYGDGSTKDNDVEMVKRGDVWKMKQAK